MNFREIKNYSRNNVKVLSGLPAAPGYAIGQAFIYERDQIEINPSCTSDPQAEIENLKYAIEKSKKELSKIIKTSREKIGDEHAKIFEAHLMILEDNELLEPLFSKIEKDKFTAEYAVHDEFSKYIESFYKYENREIVERAYEFEDVRARLIRNLQRKRWESKLKESKIIFAHNLTPADTVLLSRNDVLAYVSELGGLASHTSIISRSLNIPAVVGIHDVLTHVKNDDTVIVDGFDGLVIIKPDATMLSHYQNKIQKLKENQQKLSGFEHKTTLTADNVRIHISGNVDLISEIEILKTFHADGIGLFRSESMFFENNAFPDEAEQIDRYLAFAERVYPEKIIIRTFDIGGDKVLPHSIAEKNPFLGWRGIRMMLDEKEIFKTQLRAILKSSIHKNVSLMLPMITKIEEVWEAKSILDEVKNELIQSKQKFDENIPFGIMAEVPSIAFCIKDIAKEVDFISVGTNDLIQFTLAVDRGNDIVTKYFKEYNPSVLRILKTIVDGAHEQNIKVSICGEMASDLVLIPFLLGIGFDELSVNVHWILNIKKLLKNYTLEEMKNIANECLAMKSETEIEKYLNSIFIKKAGE